MRIGYARVSTDDQVLDLQLDALRGQDTLAIYQEHASGKSRARPELDNCLKALRAGDTLVVWRLDRLGRNLADLVQIVGALEAIPLHTSFYRYKSMTYKSHSSPNLSDS